MNKIKILINIRSKALNMCLLGFCILLAVPATAAHAQDFSLLNGEWVRPDGGYMIQVSNAKAEGPVDAAYFNPGPIHVAEANVSLWKGLEKLFVKLQDKGYPGSTYTLYYFEDKDALAGFYFQAHTGQTYEVVFMRKQKTN